MGILLHLVLGLDRGDTATGQAYEVGGRQLEHRVRVTGRRPDLRPIGFGSAQRRQDGAARDAVLLDALTAAGADTLVVAAYGRMLPPAVLEAAPGGGINVHASLLPRWRGASPVAAAEPRRRRS